MRKIVIDSLFEKKVKVFCDNLFKKKSTNFNKPIDGLKKLYNDLRPIKHSVHRKYLKKIIDEYDEIISADPTKIEKLKIEFNSFDDGLILNQFVPYKKIRFHEAIVNVMRYDALRNTEFNSFLNVAGIRSCIYCNAQSTLVIDYNYYSKKTQRKVKDSKARLELDHFYPKSLYPYLCTSFYNLYPVCGNCNRAKSKSEINFELYTRTANKSDVFKFWIDDESVLDYWLSLKNEDLKVFFQTVDGDFEFLSEYNKIFGIQGIYDTQKDIAEELVHKAKVYSNAYKENLIDNFRELFPDKSLINRLIVGTYVNSEEIHKRPMTKYMQDIAKDLGLI